MSFKNKRHQLYLLKLPKERQRKQMEKMERRRVKKKLRLISQMQHPLRRLRRVPSSPRHFQMLFLRIYKNNMTDSLKVISKSTHNLNMKTLLQLRNLLSNSQNLTDSIYKFQKIFWIISKKTLISHFIYIYLIIML